MPSSSPPLILDTHGSHDQSDRDQLTRDQTGRDQLRRELRRRRRALSSCQQHQATQKLLQQLKSLPEVQRARRVALYLPQGGEIDPTPLIDWLRKRRAQVYLPVLRPLSENRLWFVHYHVNTPMARNRFGISEPDTRHGAHHARRLPAWALDLVLMPLVGFDLQGNRMGMGGGFYDRTFAFTRWRHPRPSLIGVAHDCQGVDQLSVAPWDVPLDAIVSDRQIVRPT